MTCLVQPSFVVKTGRGQMENESLPSEPPEVTQKEQTLQARPPWPS